MIARLNRYTEALGGAARPDPRRLARRRDPIYRVNVSAPGIHVYNRDGMTTATDPFDLYPKASKQRREVP